MSRIHSLMLIYYFLTTSPLVERRRSRRLTRTMMDTSLTRHEYILLAAISQSQTLRVHFNWRFSNGQSTVLNSKSVGNYVIIVTGERLIDTNPRNNTETRVDFATLMTASHRVNFSPLQTSRLDTCTLIIYFSSFIQDRQIREIQELSRL